MLNQNEIFSICIGACEPDPDIDFVEWANRHMLLTKESSIEPGQYRTSRVPYVEEILRELSPQADAEEVIVMKPTQTGFTTLANIFLFAIADLYPGPCLFVQPTDAMAQDHSKDKIAPSLAAIDVLQGKVKEPKSRDSGNTILKKQFPGGSWTFTGSNSPVSARSKSIRYLILDDLDGFVANVGGEGDPVALFEKRCDAFGSRKKIYKNSTPTLKDFSLIHREYLSSSQGRYHVPCPFCGELQYLEFGGKDAGFGLRFEHNDALEVTKCWYECCSCGQAIEEYHKTDMLLKGKYVHKFPDRKKRGFQINSLYSPLGWLSWKSVAEEFLKAKDNQELLQVWTNTRMAEPFDVKGDQPDWSKLKTRCEPYQPLSVPDGVRLLTSGTDVQHNRLATSIYGWGKGEECWLIYHVEIAGDVMQPDVWEQHDQLIMRAFQKADGSIMQIVSSGVDAGDGQTTQAVRNYCRYRIPKVFALRGASTANKPIIGVPTKQDITWRGETILDGIEMWSIGTDTAKQTLYARLNITQPGSGYIHFYIGIDDEYFQQLTAEKIVTRFVKGYPVREWHNVRGNKRNEALDCLVYAYAAALRAGLAYMDFRNVKPHVQPKRVRQSDLAAHGRQKFNSKRGRW
jgi:phage terminase large subunit GpA-like protein